MSVLSACCQVFRADVTDPEGVLQRGCSLRADTVSPPPSDIEYGCLCVRVVGDVHVVGGRVSYA